MKYLGVISKNFVDRLVFTTGEVIKDSDMSSFINLTFWNEEYFFTDKQLAIDAANKALLTWPDKNQYTVSFYEFPEEFFYEH